MSTRREHTVSVPDEVYEYAQHVSGKPNPYTKLRDLLWKGMTADMERRTVAGNPPVPAREPAVNQDALFDDSEPDHGKPIRLRNGPEVCSECGDLISKGQYAIIRSNGRGGKEFSHLPIHHKRDKSA